jgi:hypothetical protein
VRLANGATDLIKNLEGWALGYLTVPLVLLLVAAGESAAKARKGEPAG